MIKKFQIELFVLGILFLSFFVPHNIDVEIHNFLKNFSSSIQGIFLKNFFKQITVLGDSKWYFILSLFLILFCYLTLKFNYFDKYKNFVESSNNFALYLFFSLIITGFLTQLLKNIVGRPRPDYSSFEGVSGFNFFNLNSEFHSFPSGHASTIFAVALVIIVFIPKLKYFFLFLASIVAFSRIVVGAHFFTDIIGGIVISYLGIKLTKLLLNRYYPIKKTKRVGLFYDNKIYFVLTILFFLIVFLAVGSSIDIYFSSLFYYDKSQFLLQSYYNITIFFRKIIIPLIITYVLFVPILSIIFPLQKIYFNYKFNFKDIIFLWCSSFINLIIIINLFLKNMWGRARPGDILELGGKESFTPWYQISDSCNTNCSFVSGDAAVGFSIIALYFLTKEGVFFWLSLSFGLVLGIIRVMEGGHFVSDIILAGGIVFLGYHIQLRLYKKYV